MRLWLRSQSLLMTISHTPRNPPPATLHDSVACAPRSAAIPLPVLRPVWRSTPRKTEFFCRGDNRHLASDSALSARAADQNLGPPAARSQTRGSATPPPPATPAPALSRRSPAT